jgi:hypothetical protein
VLLGEVDWRDALEASDHPPVRSLEHLDARLAPTSHRSGGARFDLIAGDLEGGDQDDEHEYVVDRQRPLDQINGGLARGLAGAAEYAEQRNRRQPDEQPRRAPCSGHAHRGAGPVWSARFPPVGKYGHAGRAADRQLEHGRRLLGRGSTGRITLRRVRSESHSGSAPRDRASRASRGCSRGDDRPSSR